MKKIIEEVLQAEEKVGAILTQARMRPGRKPSR